ncbi:triose-phosphate isomerase [Asaia platycodi]|uniref:triose-phosphate isomerase n=1 Tax=Asaia platycodi TaxID=610243 RepID=UPI0034E2BE1E
MIELGHSERREHFGETDITVNLKVKAAIRHALRPLICIGDSAEEYEFGVTHETLARQTKMALHGLTPAQIETVLLAYERLGDRSEGQGCRARFRRDGSHPPAPCPGRTGRPSDGSSRADPLWR